MEIALVLKRKNIPRYYWTTHLMWLLGIRPKDFEAIGITRVKALARRNFRKQALELSKTPKKTAKMRALIRAHQRIQKIQHPPINIYNAPEILKIHKGYRSTLDIDYGLNGPA